MRYLFHNIMVRYLLDTSVRAGGISSPQFRFKVFETTTFIKTYFETTLGKTDLTAVAASFPSLGTL